MVSVFLAQGFFKKGRLKSNHKICFGACGVGLLPLFLDPGVVYKWSSSGNLEKLLERGSCLLWGDLFCVWEGLIDTSIKAFQRGGLR